MLGITSTIYIQKTPDEKNPQDIVIQNEYYQLTFGQSNLLTQIVNKQSGKSLSLQQVPQHAHILFSSSHVYVQIFNRTSFGTTEVLGIMSILLKHLELISLGKYKYQ